MPQMWGETGVIDATYSVETLAPGTFAIYFESWSGAAGTKFSRNSEYTAGLEALLFRLARMRATVNSIELAPANRPGRVTLNVPDRPYPWKLGTSTDPGQLRVRLGRAQAATNSRPGSGNRTKRLCIYCRVPEFSDSGALSLALGARIVPAQLSPDVDREERAGFQASPEVRLAVEQHAMTAAIHHYEAKGWNVDSSVARTESFDLLCVRSREILHVEAKGTTGSGREVLLTWREVEHAKTFPNVALVVVSGILVTPMPLTAYGGKIAIFDPWKIASCHLSATQYRCELPRVT